MVVGILTSGAMVLSASWAAFSAITSNSGNAVSVGSVDLVDDDSDSAMFAVTNMVPGDSAIHCIEVTYQGTVADPGSVELYSGGLVDSGTLADALDLTVEEGTGGDFSTCTGFTSSATLFSDTLGNFDSSHTDYASGIGSWDPSSTPESTTYRITIDLPSSASSSVQGESITDLVFTWEVQS